MDGRTAGGPDTLTGSGFWFDAYVIESVFSMGTPRLTRRVLRRQMLSTGGRADRALWPADLNAALSFIASLRRGSFCRVLNAQFGSFRGSGQGANGFATRWSTGVNSGKWRSSTVDMLLSLIQSRPALV